MAKWGKKLLGLAAIGGAAAGLVYYLKSKEELDLDDFDDELDDDACSYSHFPSQRASQKLRMPSLA